MEEFEKKCIEAIEKLKNLEDESRKIENQYLEKRCQEYQNLIKEELKCYKSITIL